MSPVRPPVIAALAPDSGASALAAALHTADAHVLGHRVAGEADVVACRATTLRDAATLACAASGPRPALAVLLDPAGPDAVAPLLAAVRTRFDAVVALPHVPGWSGRTDVREEAAAVLGFHLEHLNGPLRAYAVALRSLVSALTGNGVLTRSTPPMVSRPSTGGLWPGLRTVERVIPARPVPPPAEPAPVIVAPRRPVPPELDDDALEALLHPPVPAGRGG